ncbi:MAG TPA: RNA polymerase subunit sigma [Flavobacteriales bacterium]|nr:RNA polymerase subunit sigma [Flavobacteriales bacterium]|tara:strand:+ start:753 stop:1262 length:510 start_codon:yes stop_codon:yes gene_type:complete
MTAIEFNYQITNLQVHLKSFALKLTSNDVDSEDLVQETTLKALRFRDKFVDSSNLKAWLFTIMKNTYINDYRKKKRASTFLEEAAVVARMRMGSAADCGSVESTISEKRIIDKINSLPEEYKAPFNLHFEGYKYKEISEMLGIPMGTVKSRIFAARKMLADRLSEYDRN